MFNNVAIEDVKSSLIGAGYQEYYRDDINTIFTLKQVG